MVENLILPKVPVSPIFSERNLLKLIFFSPCFFPFRKNNRYNIRHPFAKPPVCLPLPREPTWKTWKPLTASETVALPMLIHMKPFFYHCFYCFTVYDVRLFDQCFTVYLFTSCFANCQRYMSETFEVNAHLRQNSHGFPLLFWSVFVLFFKALRWVALDNFWKLKMRVNLPLY